MSKSSEIDLPTFLVGMRSPDLWTTIDLPAILTIKCQALTALFRQMQHPEAESSTQGTIKWERRQLQSSTENARPAKRLTTRMSQNSKFVESNGSPRPVKDD
jgi:hypothetical protein